MRNERSDDNRPAPHVERIDLIERHEVHEVTLHGGAGLAAGVIIGAIAAVMLLLWLLVGLTTIAVVVAIILVLAVLGRLARYASRSAGRRRPDIEG